MTGVVERGRVRAMVEAVEVAIGVVVGGAALSWCGVVWGRGVWRFWVRGVRRTARDVVTVGRR